MLELVRSMGRSRRTPLFALILLIFLFLLGRSNLDRLDEAYNFADNLSYDLPMQQYFNERLLNGELPLWNAYQSGGNPMIGTLEARLIYPPRLILTLVFGLNVGQLLEVIFHFCLTVIGSYAMLRSFRLKRMASMVGALSVMLSVEFLNAFAAFNVIATVAWVPVCIWSIRKFLYRPDLTTSAILAFSFSMLIYAGYPQYAYYAAHVCVIVFLFGAFHLRRRLMRHPVRFLLLISTALTLFALVSGAQIITSAELFSRGLRSEVGVTLQQFNPFGSRSILVLLPHLYGGAQMVPPQPGQAPTIQYPPHLYALPLMVALSAILGYAMLREYRLRILTMVAIVIPFALLASGGEFANWIFNNYPLGSAFRVPQRLLFLLLFPSAFFLGLAFVIVDRKIRKTSLRLAGTVALLFALALLLVPGKALKTQAFMHISKHIDHYAENLRKVIPESSYDRYDTICYFGLEPCQKAGMIARRRSLTDYEPANTYRSYLFSRLVSSELRNLPEGYLWLGETNINIDTFTDPAALKLLQAASVKWVMASSELWRKTTPEHRTRIKGVGLVTPVDIVPDDTARARLLEKVGEEKLKILLELLPKDTSLYTIFKLEGTVSRAYLTNRIETSASAKDSARILEPPFDPMKQTVLEIPEHLRLTAGKTVPADHMKRADFIVDKPEHIVIRTDAAGEAFLVLNDKYFPGWECRVDGQLTTIYPANIMFRAIRLSPGKHEVEFVYKPWNFYVSFIVSLVGYAILIAFLVVGRKRLKKEQ
ncbi:MAG: YfhO family protein [Leptospirales bacterium]|nr:YfhO family protein [Leptospirales bacterium]